MSNDPTFMSRWSQRKQQARHAEAEEDTVDTLPDAEEAVSEEPDKSDAEILEELGLKDPDEMGKDDDFSVFMQSAIPTRLRNRALRKLWLSNPTLANLDALVDYGEDYTDAATVVENLVTAYKVGKGYLKQLSEDEEADTPVPEDAPDSTGVEEIAEADTPADDQVEPEDPVETEDPPETEVSSTEAAPAEPSAPRQRMNFRF